LQFIKKKTIYTSLPWNQKHEIWMRKNKSMSKEGYLIREREEVVWYVVLIWEREEVLVNSGSG
jgi:hypothetical protein